MILITGAGGFIGGHLCQYFIDKGISVRAVDIKPFNEWYQVHDKCENISKDLKIYENCFESIQGTSEVYNLACDMGGMGFIEDTGAAQYFCVVVLAD